ncbi:MAG TPA: TetR-like C-terminal domain-containing protein [Chloroflexota bacterium]
MLREVTRLVGVVPNAAYRHFADRDALLAAVRDAAVAELARRMAEGIARVRARPRTPTGARLRLHAIGQAYLAFARTEPGLFDTAFASGLQHSPAADRNDAASPLDLVRAALDDLVAAGVLNPARRPLLEYPTWGAVHGLAVLLRGPLRMLPAQEQAQLEAHTLAFIEASVTSSGA